MRSLRSKILFLILLSFAPRAFAQNSCHLLFEVVRPSEAKIQQAFVELKNLAQQKYSKDTQESAVAKIVFQEKHRELLAYFTPQEVTNRLKQIHLESSESALSIPKEELRTTSEKLILVSEFLNEHGYQDVHQIILKEDPSDRNNFENRSALTYAVALKRTDLVEPLLEMQADVNGSPAHTIPIIEAIKTRNLIAIKLLLKYGADINIISKKIITQNENTPLLQSLESRNTKLVKYLIKNGADVNLKMTDGKTPLFKAVQYSSSIVEILLKNGADPTIKDNNGVSILSMIPKASPPSITETFSIPINGTQFKILSIKPAREIEEEQIRQMLIEAGATE